MWAKQAGKAIRSLGQTIDRVGVSLEGKLTYTEHLNPSTRAVKNLGRAPKFEEADAKYYTEKTSILPDEYGRHLALMGPDEHEATIS
ncbi:hypothetical protein PF005_g24588 [Phytophthora fragariae]|uniref:Uncharacterized protein n=1 Tax=Phytophthora fragariae TaxID=53985 RepID=A0A6A3IED7_9STRA|nr:hypothetical protein PF003_g31577 [Phytophthora fragariae]KAE8924737.1 hypothetical protein PF009_g25037 [Phytophthora fragariae]KAE8978845.1 hypothetical protein PF011_g23077 [Phytophthora fragariae]KAE9077102.1 hypothetical protein PF007_g24368 [Phytophthora fragariae]KAE9079427.1 hypothetical protein PF010_g22756 [Phytophthora fragariae]